MADRKPCKVCNFTRQKSYGVVVPSLEELKVKVDGGTAWMARDSVMLESDTVDAAHGSASWLDLALQLKRDLASIILMCEEDLECLVGVPCPELASALGFQEKKTENLQETLQRVLDRREEERQSKELLQLFLKAAEKEDGQPQEEAWRQSEGGADVPDGMEVDQACGFTSRTLMVLKGKTSPETRLSTEDLQMVVAKGAEAMQQVLGWDKVRTSTLLQDCESELKRRLQQIQAVQSMRGNMAQRDSSLPPNDKNDEESKATLPRRGK
ncbi:DNA fragmentation factor subunit alpha isoform X4 [Hippocampus comes]|uniref:DNA fragmentation factor subunit alpha isoform X4 n=1 Tax=Hippocampus comes TaxID=109280 RepID=UPI00094EAC26|nr:PREDICTED: DNA fragmentation factor subunit alpha isoform X4 [Hippocampus comes]